MGLRDTYNHAIQTAKGFGMQGGAEERDGKLYFKGTVATQDQANKIWDAIKTIPTWSKDVVADIKATGQATNQTTTPAAAKTATYTVKAGDTLYSIAQRFNTGVDTLRNLNKLSARSLIQPGLKLRLP